MRDLTDTPNLPDSSGSRPTFDDWEDPDRLFDGGSTKERMVDVIVQLHEPTKVATIAERAGCDTETARNYLGWFVELGLVNEFSGRPARYARNESYLRWRRVERIRTRYSDEEIVDELQTVMDAIQSYQDRFDVDTPGQVSLTEASVETTVADAWDALSAWKTLERRADVLDAALRDSATTRGRPISNA